VLRNAGEVHEEMDCGGRCLIPGFVDPHTHMCFSTTREEEFSLRLAGANYLEILRQGGGILSSVRAVRTASEEELFLITAERVRSALRFGTTTLEIKSGYGLDTEVELKMLRVIHRIGEETPLDVVATFLGAHAVPDEYVGAPDRYVDLVVQEMIPAVSGQGIARFCDVFCERGVFTPEQSRRILMAAREHGLELKIHADEIHDLGGGALAAELGAVSAEHLLAVSDKSLRAMASARVTAILLPGTAYSLRKPYARARKMVELGVPLALATDCNPGTCYTESMPFVSGLAILAMGLSPNEALVAGTLNAAYAVGMAGSAGSLERGKAGDFLLLDGKSPAILAYRAGISPVVEVYKRGERVA
jgi:imidazolonepropionase